MLIVNDDHRMLTGMCGLDDLCPYCGLAFVEYPLIMSDEAKPTVYHAACALQLATEILLDLFTCLRPPAPHARLFTLTRPRGASPREGDHHAINES
jgi:hypothetical protein